MFVSLFTIDTDKPLHVVFSDRSKGLLGALDSELPDAYSQACTRHLMKKVPSLTVSQEGLIWGMQSARTKDQYELQFENLQKVNRRAAM